VARTAAARAARRRQAHQQHQRGDCRKQRGEPDVALGLPDLVNDGQRYRQIDHAVHLTPATPQTPLPFRRRGHRQRDEHGERQRADDQVALCGQLGHDRADIGGVVDHDEDQHVDQRVAEAVQPQRPAPGRRPAHPGDAVGRCTRQRGQQQRQRAEAAALGPRLDRVDAALTRQLIEDDPDEWREGQRMDEPIAAPHDRAQ
jgi:hypothetical protein